MSAHRFVERRKDESDVKQIDCGVKNSFKWAWMEHLVDGHMLGQWFRKIRAPGKAYCTLCRKEVNYASRGRKALDAHVSMTVHSSKVKEIKTNDSLPECDSCHNWCAIQYFIGMKRARLRTRIILSVVKIMPLLPMSRPSLQEEMLAKMSQFMDVCSVTVDR